MTNLEVRVIGSIKSALTDLEPPGKLYNVRIIHNSNEEYLMTSGIKTIIYPVKDLDQAKEIYGKLLGAEPYADAPYYVGFRVGDQEIGLDPNGHSHGMTAYWHVDDIVTAVKQLEDAGAETLQEVHDVGGGRQIASLKDRDGNVIGLVQSP
ncbi:MAG TPA: VOC family protein [Rhodothermales bacterium]|nr:VOC family protein [Rhodothermales bacterium]